MIPNSVTSIGFRAFMNNEPITVRLYATTPPIIDSDIFLDTPVKAIYVPTESVEIYKKAENWSKFTDKISSLDVFGEVQYY